MHISQEIFHFWQYEHLTLPGVLDLLQLPLQLRDDNPLILVASACQRLHPQLHALLSIGSQYVAAVPIEDDLEAVVVHIRLQRQLNGATFNYDQT